MSKRWSHHRSSVLRKQKRDANKLSQRELVADEIHDVLRDLKQEVKQTKELQRKWEDDKKRENVEEDYKYHARQIVKHAEALRSRLGFPSENVKELNEISRLKTNIKSLEKRLKEAGRFDDQERPFSSNSRETTEDSSFSKESENYPRKEIPVEQYSIQQSRAEPRYSEQGDSMDRKRRSERLLNKQDGMAEKKRRQSSDSSDFNRKDSKREPVPRQSTGSLRREPKLEALRTELETMTAEKASLEDAYMKLKEEKQQLLENIEQLKKNLTDKEYDNKELSERAKNAVIELNKARDYEGSLTTQIKQQQQMLSDKEEEIKTLRDNTSRFSDRSGEATQEINRLNAQSQKQQQMLADRDQEIRRIKDRNNDIDEKSQVNLTEKLSALETQLKQQQELLDEKEIILLKNEETFNARLKESDETSQVTLLSLTENLSKVEMELNEQKKLLDIKDKELTSNDENMARMQHQIELANTRANYEQKEKNKHYESFLQSRDAEQNLRESVDKLQANLSAERASKEEALTRLSAFAGHKLRDNNPGVTDLSDPNRPMKLAEKVSELYDNQWTNAMENLEDIGLYDDRSIQLLLEIFTESYRSCREAGDRQLGPILSGHYLALPDIENVRARTPIENMNLDPLSTEISKPLKDYRKLHCEKADQYIAQVMMEKFKKMPGFDDKIVKACEVFIQHSVRYTWMMVVQDPPVHMEWKFHHGDEFDNNRLRSYTKGGKYLDFMVWPVLYLHEGGPLLAKGVAQGMKHKN